jgi:plastocyanin
MFRRVSRLAVTAFSVALLLAACGSGGGSSSSGGSGYGGGPGAAGGSTGGGGGADQTITIQNFAFDPSTLTLPSGQDVTIEVTNDDEGVEHSFTLDDDSVSQDVEGGETKTVTLNLTQGIGWHCEYHPQTMKGTITVS